jgi:hypothetical protein
LAELDESESHLDGADDGEQVGVEEEPVLDRPQAADVEPTVGTGSVFAIGCTLLTVVIIAVGIGIFLLLQLR